MVQGMKVGFVSIQLFYADNLAIIVCNKKKKTIHLEEKN